MIIAVVWRNTIAVALVLTVLLMVIFLVFLFIQPIFRSKFVGSNSSFFVSVDGDRKTSQVRKTSTASRKASVMRKISAYLVPFDATILENDEGYGGSSDEEKSGKVQE